MNLKLNLIKSNRILILILLSTLLLRLIRLDYPNEYIFDEVYHAFTAKEYLKLNHEAWEWWTTPPPGVAYEWTHPPLAKEIMTLSMFIFQTQDAWAYRLPGVFLGTLSVYLIYLLGMQLLKSKNAALISSFVFSIDGLNFVQSRVGMNDIYYVSFILISLLFFLRKKIFFSAVFFGLAIACKWAAIYIVLIYLPLLVIFKNLKGIIYLLIIPLLIYLLSYTPFFLLNHTPSQFIELQKQMFWYHTNLEATHDYTSPFWSWPLNLYPVWYFVDYRENSMANIFSSGNPIVFWVGLLSIIFAIYQGLKKRIFSLFLIGLGFLVFWLPWAISPRIMFLYHFSPSVAFMSLAIGYQLNQGLSNKSKKTVFILLLLMFIGFIFIYPFLTGIFIPRDLINIFFLTNLSKNPF